MADTEAEPSALADYRRRTRRATRIYAAVLAAVVLLAVLGVKLAYAHGELNKVSFRTATAPATLPAATPSTRLAEAWHTSETAAAGDPYDGGTVVTYSGHTVNGRDAVTGAVRWHYTRSDETLCSVLQQDGSTIAIYLRKGNCDEVTGFVTATGRPKWYRTLTDNGITTAASVSNDVMTVSPHGVHVFDNDGGLDRWNWSAPDGCVVRHALAGSLGVLISQDCAAGHQLVLHDAIADSVKWTVDTPTAMLPIAADAFVGALDPGTGSVQRFTPDKGASRQTARVPAGPSSPDGGLPTAVAAVSATDAAGQPVQLVWLARPRRLLAMAGDGSVLWFAPATGPAWPVTSAFVASLAGPDQVPLRRVDGGQAQLTSTLTPPAASADARIYPVASGLLVAGDTDTVRYR